jgi:hypothetical protein
MPVAKGHAERKATLKAAVMAKRRAGHAYSAIGKELGISGPTAYRYAQEALREFQVRTDADVQEHVALQVARLDAALASLEKRLAGGNVNAIDTMLKIEARRARLLGLDAPAKVAPTSPDGVTPYQGEVVGLAALLAEARKGDT